MKSTRLTPKIFILVNLGSSRPFQLEIKEYLVLMSRYNNPCLPKAFVKGSLPMHVVHPFIRQFVCSDLQRTGYTETEASRSAEYREDVSTKQYALIKYESRGYLNP